MAASPQQAPFDIRSLSACPIRLGRSAQQASAPSRYTGIQYNHKPTTSSPKQTSTSINPPELGSKQYSLRLKDGQDEYLYKGSQGTTEHTYILVPDQEGDGYVLERLDASYKFNLSKAPWESSAQVLGERYPQLETTADHDDNDEEGELFGDGAAAAAGDEGEADDDNPFDFRHYMHTVESPSPPSHPTKSSVIGTPSSVVSQTLTRTNTPLAKSTTKKAPSAFALQERRIAAKAKTKAKTEERQQAQPKRAKLSPEAEQQRREDIPTVRLDRRASTRVAAPAKKKAESRPQQQQQQQRQQHLQNETDELSLDFDDHDDDNDGNEGDLILEGDAPPTSSYRNQRSLGAALPGTLGMGNGPRSLQSAASSPASMVNSPRSLQQHGNGRGGTSPYDRNVDTDGEEIEIDMGPGSPDELELDDGGYVDEDADAEGDVDDDDGDGGELVIVDDADDDEDVDEMHLPSPAQVHRPSVSNTVVTADEDDDLENQMLLALEGGDDDMLGGLQESEEESEEE